VLSGKLFMKKSQRPKILFQCFFKPCFLLMTSLLVALTVSGQVVRGTICGTESTDEDQPSLCACSRGGVQRSCRGIKRPRHQIKDNRSEIFQSFFIVCFMWWKKRCGFFSVFNTKYWSHCRKTVAKCETFRSICQKCQMSVKA